MNSENNQKLWGKDEIVDIELVYPNSWNPKENIDTSRRTRKIFKQLKKQIKDKGLFEAITVREKEQNGKKYQILDGYHRYRACLELGFNKIRINNLGPIEDDNLAKAITIIKERKKIPINEALLGDVIAEMNEELDLPDLAELLGEKEDLVKDFVDLGYFDWERYTRPPEPMVSELSDEKKQEKEISYKEYNQEKNENINYNSNIRILSFELDINEYEEAKKVIEEIKNKNNCSDSEAFVALIRNYKKIL